MKGFPDHAIGTRLSAADSSQFERKHECVLHCWSVPMHVMHVFDVRELPLGFLFLLVLTLSLSFSPLSTLGRLTVWLAQCFAHCIKEGSRRSSKVPCDKAGRDGMVCFLLKKVRGCSTTRFGVHSRCRQRHTRTQAQIGLLHSLPDIINQHRNRIKYQE